MKVLVDMNLSPRWVDMLNGLGLQATHWSAVGRVNAPDSEIMDYAAANDYIVKPLLNSTRLTRRGFPT